MSRPSKNNSSMEDKLAEAARLRDQLHREILESKKLCSYEAHECRQLRFENYNYCQRHILKDEKAPYKQCAYVYNVNGKRCHMPAPKIENKLGYCVEHIKKAAIAKYRTNQKIKPVDTSETLLASLSHYVKRPSSRRRSHSGVLDSGRPPSRRRTVSGNSGTSDKDEESKPVPEDNDIKVVTKSLDPFIEIDAAKINISCSDILEYASESDSDVEPTIFANTWNTANAESSENESIDSESEDPLKHAEIYTAEEVCSITRDKLIQLQDLYTREFSFLQTELKEKRRKYVQSIKKEKEIYASIHNQVRDNPRELHLYNKLKALNCYQKRTGVEAILQKRAYDLRAKATEGIQHKTPTFSKCIFTEGGVKCGERPVPMCKYCPKHVLCDPQQVLFRACGVTRADITCHEPVPDVFPGQACVYHTDVPTVRSYTHMKRDEDTDLDDSTETIDPGAHPATIEPNKTIRDINLNIPPPDTSSINLKSLLESSEPNPIKLEEKTVEEPNFELQKDIKIENTETELSNSSIAQEVVEEMQISQDDMQISCEQTETVGADVEMKVDDVQVDEIKKEEDSVPDTVEETQ